MKRNINILFIWGVFLLAGCVMEEEITSPSGVSSGEIVFELHIPGHKIPCLSRSTTYDENTVKTLDVLLFEPAGKGARKFKRHEEITGYTTDMEGNVRLKLKFIPEEAGCEVVFVANAAGLVESITGSDTKLTALEKLNIIREDKWDIQRMPVPMYGETVLKETDILPGKKIEGINLVRMLARIDVKVNSEVYNFTLDRVYLCNRPTQGYLSLRWDSKGNVDQGKVTDPNWSPYFSYADDQSMSNATLENDLNIQYDADPDHNNCIGKIYTFEAEGKAYDSESPVATSLVIKGYLDNDFTQAYYYRVDFTDTDGNFMPLLRNHQYHVEITAVNGIGYSNLKEALEAYTVVSNMHTRTIVWNNEILSHINYNGQYMLGVQYEEMIFSSKGDQLENFIATDYGYGITLMEKPDWIAVDNFSNGDTEAYLEIRVDANPDLVAREGEIKLLAGRLTHTIRVRQDKKSDRSNAIVNIASVTGIGFPGYTNGTGTNASIGMRRVLDTHFKAGGVVELKQINYHAITNNPMVTDTYLSDKDVIFLVYAAIPTAQTMNRIINWLEASPNRVLVISFDTSGTNPEAFKLNYFKEDISGIRYSSHSSYEVDLVHTPGAEYFWQDGPFTNGERIERATYRNSDATFGKATLTSTSGILPLFELDGAMVFGVNKEKRIVYIGDSQYGEALTGSTYQGKRFNNSQGNVNNDVEKIFSNLWAWIIDEVVLKDPSSL